MKKRLKWFRIVFVAVLGLPTLFCIGLFLIDTFYPFAPVTVDMSEYDLDALYQNPLATPEWLWEIIPPAGSRVMANANQEICLHTQASIWIWETRRGGLGVGIFVNGHERTDVTFVQLPTPLSAAVVEGRSPAFFSRACFVEVNLPPGEHALMIGLPRHIFSFDQFDEYVWVYRADEIPEE